MKLKDRYKIINHAKRYYSETFNQNYEFKKLSKKALYKLLEENKHSTVTKQYYCCYGLYKSCWCEPFFEGSWCMTQKQVDEVIKYIIDETAKICRRDSRILYCEDEQGVHVIIIARDVMSEDYLIRFTNIE